MHAWTKSGNPIEHPKPWGVYGAFSTLRITGDSKILFQKDHFERIYNTAQYLELPWVPEPDELNSRIQTTLPQPSTDHDHLLRICIFEDILGLSYRPALSDGNPVEGWLLSYRRPDPSVKCTAEKDLYGTLHELEIEKEDWIIHDPKDNELRETATSNLLFVRDGKLMIPENKILQGITVQKILPLLHEKFPISRGIPKDQEVSEFDEILLCGTGRGVAPLIGLPELGWSSSGDSIFSEIRSIYETLVGSDDAKI
jgi:branched-subunit amino acid aminotransferase/4-amino-4-deoxychorismate lyase